TTDGQPDEVRIVVRDTGVGIPAEDVDKIFDPFFTSKEVGQGTGLGLAVSYGIIERHGGMIVVESTAGEGTVFIITLPVGGSKAEDESEAIHESGTSDESGTVDESGNQSL
ncbi:MAG TPA: ATP-binding protein, partial [Thermoguttaceae bacterium]|nr:ATP-binding protein [Thermoguttaceae bacterium]